MMGEIPSFLCLLEKLFIVYLFKGGMNMFFKKLKEAPLYYWEEKSYIMALLPENEDENILKNILKNLDKSKEIKVLDSSIDYATQVLNFQVQYKKKKYDVGLYVGNVNVPEYYLNTLAINEEKKKTILEAKKCVTIFMNFDDDAKACFHLQLKLAHLLVPEMLGLLDESAERFFLSDWVKLTATSKYTPSSKDLFSVQAVSDDDGSVWLHTHGLARCNLTELEVFGATSDNSRNYYNLINSYAMYLIDKKDDGESAHYIGRLINGMPIVATYVSWVDALKYYKHLKNGGEKDRKNGHNSKTSVIFLYTSEENERNNVLTKVSEFDNLWGDNPLFFISDAETNRMKDIAIERFDYVRKAFKDKKNKILLKIGLPLDEKGKYEHIWFELLEFKKDKFKARLTQEPYYFDDIHEGYEAWYTLKDLTDWIIYTDNKAIVPDSAFLLD